MMSRLFRRIGVTLKKRRLVAREQDRADIESAIAGAGEPIRSASILLATGASSTRPGPRPTRTRLYGWAARGRRLVAKIPHGHWKTAIFPAALRNDRIDAPCVFDGPINGERLLAYVEQFLVPTLKRNDIVVLDNLGCTKAKPCETRSRPPARVSCSFQNTHPTSTRSSNFFAKIKGFVRKAAPRTLDAVSDAIAQALTTVPPDECANYLTGAGYASA